MEGPTETIHVAVARLAALDPLDYEACRKAEADALGVRMSVLDAAVDRSRLAEDRSETASPFADDEPWPEPVDGAALLDAIEAELSRHLVLPDRATPAIALWTLFAHAIDAFEHAPILLLSSPEKRCGKSTTCRLVAALTPRAWHIVGPTGPAIFRAIEKWGPTLVLDEGDQLRLGDAPDILAILNSGHERSSAWTLRCVGEDFEPSLFATWAPKVFAGIGQPPDTLHDRSIEIRLRRKTSDERVERLRGGRDTPGFERLRRMAARWAADHLERLRGADDPAEPDGLGDRALDNWRPLFLIADACGGRWPDLARSAAVALSRASAAGDDDDAPGVMLLRDLREVFEARPGSEFLTSSEIVEALGALEDGPWSTWRRGQPILPRGVKKLLGPFGVTPCRRAHANGYLRADLVEPWARYLEGSPEPSPKSSTSSSASTTFEKSEAYAAASSTPMEHSGPSGGFGGHGGFSETAREKAPREAAAKLSATARRVRDELLAELAAERTPRGRRALGAALRFTTEGWLDRAVAAGWTDAELLGRDALAPWERLDLLGAAYVEWPAVEVTPEAITYDAKGDRQRRLRRR